MTNPEKVAPFTEKVYSLPSFVPDLIGLSFCRVRGVSASRLFFYGASLSSSPPLHRGYVSL